MYASSEVSPIHEQVICVVSLQEEAKIHGYSSSLVSKIIELESFLEKKKKAQMDITTNAVDMKSHANEDLRSL